MARFMQGQVDIPLDIWPLVSRKHDLAVLSGSQHTTSDLYVIELASAKQITIDGVSIQLNYLNATYTEFFAERRRARSFWTLAEAGDADAIAAFLQETWTATPEQIEQAALLVRIRLQMVTAESLRTDIETLNALLPDVLFVSHVDARKSDGQTIRSRSAFIQMVKEQVTDAGCKFFNPTDLMAEYGQTNAIEDESAGLAHFTEAFADGMMQHWMRQVIAPKTDQAALHTGNENQLRPQVLAACEQSAFVDIRARLSALAGKGANVASLLTDTNQAQVQAQSVFSKFSMEAAQSNLSVDEWCGLIMGAAKLGLFDAATELANLAPQPLPALTALCVADLASLAGDVDAAISFYATAAKQDKPRAYAQIAKIALGQGLNPLAQIGAAERAKFLAAVPPIERVQLLQLDGASFAEALPQSATADEARQVVSYLASHHGIGYAAEVLGTWREGQGSDRIRDEALISMLDRWIETALVADNAVDRIHGLNAVLFASPRHGPARNAMRDARKDLVERIRAAGRTDDIETLDALTIEASALATDLPELDLWRARLRFKLGEFETAIALGQSAARYMPDTINVWVLLMRAAVKINDQSRAVLFAHKVKNLACTKTAALSSEAEALLQANLVEV